MIEEINKRTLREKLKDVAIVGTLIWAPLIALVTGVKLSANLESGMSDQYNRYRIVSEQIRTITHRGLEVDYSSLEQEHENLARDPAVIAEEVAYNKAKAVHGIPLLLGGTLPFGVLGSAAYLARRIRR